MQKITFSCDYFRREEDFNAYHDLPVQYRQWADYEAHPVYREVFKQILQQTAEESIKDSWSCEEETPQFLTKLFRQYKKRIVPRTLPFSKICEACSTLDVLTEDFEHEVNLATLRQMATTCALCRLLLKCSLRFNLGGLPKFTLAREDSTLYIVRFGVILKICVDPGMVRRMLIGPMLTLRNRSQRCISQDTTRIPNYRRCRKFGAHFVGAAMDFRMQQRA